MDAFWIILTGAIVAVSCSLLGCFLVLRKSVMVGDAISHAVLPGIVLAYLFSQTLQGPFTLLGALLAGMLTTLLIERLTHNAKIKSEASIGIVFTTLFALGVVLVSFAGENIDLDQDCILYGEIAYVPFDTFEYGKYSLGPSAIWQLGIVLLAVLIFIAVGYKGLLLTTFDPLFAAVQGVSVSKWHYSLMGFVSASTVAAFEAVGAILVVAFLVVPPATAYLVSSRLPTMLLLACAAGVLSAVSGYGLAYWLDSSIAACMAVASGVWFVIALVGQKLFRC